MLIIKIPARDDMFDEDTGQFFKMNEQTIKLEHSLLSLQKWEAKHNKYFLDNHDLSAEEILDYIRCMTLNQVPDWVYNCLTPENITEIRDYIQAPMTATWFSPTPGNHGGGQREIITAEVIYSSMFILNIPLDFEKRHLNHLLTLIRVCNEKQNPDTNKKKVSDYEMLRHYSELNKKRKAAMKNK